MKCAACNKEITDNSKFCPYCGNSIQAPELKLSALEDKEEKTVVKKNKTPVIIAVIVVATLLIAALALFVIVPKIDYNNALKAMDEGRWSDARSILEKRNYADASSLIEECYMHEYADYNFLRTLETSITQRLANADADYNTIVEAELILLDQFSNSDFYNNGIKEQATKYIKGVKRQQSSIDEYDDHSGYFLSDMIGWDEGRLQRYEAIAVLVKEYGLLSSDQATATDCVNYLETAKASLEIDKDIQDQLVGAYAEYNDKTGQYYLKYKNRTDYEFDADFYACYFYGERLETDEFNEYGIRPGEVVTLNLVTFTRETTGPDTWIVDWVAYDIYKDGVLLPD